MRGLDLLWSWDSLWKGRGRIWGLKNGIRTPLAKGLVLGKGFGVLRFRGLFGFLLLLNLVSKHTDGGPSTRSINVQMVQNNQETRSKVTAIDGD